MFKSLSMISLIGTSIVSSYALQSVQKPLPSDNKGIHQNIEEVKDVKINNNSQQQTSELFDFDKIIKSKKYKDMTNDEKDWMQLRAYSGFSNSCQKFIQYALINKDIPKEFRHKFYNTKIIKFCILTGLCPRQIFEDELKFNIDEKCYLGKADLLPVLIRLSKVASVLDKDMAYQREYFIKQGDVDSFDM